MVVLNSCRRRLCSPLVRLPRVSRRASSIFEDRSVPHVALHGTPDERLAHFGQTAARQITLQQLISYGHPTLSAEALVQLGEYTRVELPHLLALRVKAHEGLPYIVGTNPYIARIYELYSRTFREIAAVPPIRSVEDNVRFADQLALIVREHTDNIPTLAQGFKECRRFLTDEQSTRFLDKAIQNRISLRLIAEHHISLTTGSTATDDPVVSSDSDLIGVVDLHCSPIRMINACADFVAGLCEHAYGRAPRLVVDGATDATFTYVPVHMEYILTELIKNAYRATAERHARSDQLPPVTITIASAPTLGTVSLRIRDLGGGIPPADLARCFTYAYTSVDASRIDDDEAGPYAAQAEAGGAALDNFVGMAQTGMSTIAGYGYGLPLSRLYARFFGGELEVVSLYPSGCDVFVTLGSIVQPRAQGLEL